MFYLSVKYRNQNVTSTKILTGLNELTGSFTVRKLLFNFLPDAIHCISNPTKYLKFSKNSPLASDAKSSIPTSGRASFGSILSLNHTLLNLDLLSDFHLSHSSVKPVFSENAGAKY